MFYPQRTVEQQALRLPEQFRSKYRVTQLDRIKIDGIELQGYFEYSYLAEKSYKTQPERSDDGSIIDIDEYATFLTPRLLINYNMMEIEDYRKLMQILQRKNAFLVEFYDIVSDTRMTAEMYAATPQMPVIYQRYLTALGIQEYSIELIGTNRKTHLSITYNINFEGSNDPNYLKERWEAYYGEYAPTTIRIDNLNFNQMHTIEAFKDPDGADVSDIEYYRFVGWTTIPTYDVNGKFDYYYPGEKYYLSNDLTLYAQWVAV